MGVELEKGNVRLGRIEGVLSEGAIKEADEIVDQGLNYKWFNLWRDSKLKEVRKLEEENEVFWEFLRSREAEDSEDSGSKSESGAEEGEVVGSGEAIGTRVAAEIP